ncbi:HNH endonuclease [Brevundimonas staleyi]|uniref:HNH endonuclease n=1 Tax=Brevundimonas staleyi TaxID=74326 RepID=A0ABW0FXT1_9CAUL
MGKRMSEPERVSVFWSRVERGASRDDCWLWKGGRSGPYGIVQWREHNGVTMPRHAHTIAFLLARGWRPTRVSKLVVRHLCHQPLCCNPSHLRHGSQADNAADDQAVGREARGETQANAKLDDDMVRFMRWEAARGTTHRELAAIAGVARQTASKAIAKKTWTHIR